MNFKSLETKLLPPVCLHEYHLMSEYNSIMTYHPPGVYILPSLNMINSWDGIISIRKGFYTGGIFSFNIQIPQDFPCDESPKIFMPCGFYHPNINLTTGQVDVGVEFSKWTPGSSRIYNLLHHFRCILNDIYIDDSIKQTAVTDTHNIWSKFANPEATSTLALHPDEFEKLAKQYVEEKSLWSSTDSSTNGSIFHSGAPPLNVLGWQNDTFVNGIREKIASSSEPFKSCPCCSDASCRGYSWIDPTKMSLFSPDRLCTDQIN